MEKVDAIILAGGLGTRLRGVVSDLPKVLLPVDGKPFLDILLYHLHKSGMIGKVILAVGYMAEKVIEYCRNSRTFSFSIVFSVETELLGTGGAIRKAIGYSDTETIFVMNGDSYVDVNLEAMAAAHRAKKAAMTMVIKEVPNVSRYGRVLLDTNGRLVAFEEKKNDPASGYINTGVYLFNRNLVNGVAEDRVLSWEKDLLPGFLSESVYGFLSQGKFIDIGIPETYKMSGDYLKGIIS
jgi:D-glycero-alpha-D-manno-heptose 1-phosphate guanylyltransferase